MSWDLLCWLSTALCLPQTVPLLQLCKVSIHELFDYLLQNCRCLLRSSSWFCSGDSLDMIDILLEHLCNFSHLQQTRYCLTNLTQVIVDIVICCSERRYTHGPKCGCWWNNGSCCLDDLQVCSSWCAVWWSQRWNQNRSVHIVFPSPDVILFLRPTLYLHK